MANTELVKIIEKFAKSGWDVIDTPAKKTTCFTCCILLLLEFFSVNLLTSPV